MLLHVAKMNKKRFFSISVLGRAIHSLAKLGDELYVESSQADLSFRTVNMSKTAYASFTFSIDFFSFFKDESIADQNAGVYAKLIRFLFERLQISSE